MKKEEFLRRKNELKEKLRDTYIIVDEGIGCSLAMGCYFDHQVNKWKVFENGDRDTHYILLETSSEDEAFDLLNYMMMEDIKWHEEEEKERQQYLRERQKRLKEEREMESKASKIRQVFFCNGFTDEWIKGKRGTEYYVVRRDGKMYCHPRYIKEKRAFVIESATNKQDAENEILRVDPDIYYIDEPEKEMLKRLDENVMANYM
jgi:hypothetical protein